MSALHIKLLKRELALSYAAKTNLLLTSKPAIGKSQTVLAASHELAKRVENFGYWSFDVSTANPNDVVVYMPCEKTGKLTVYPNGVRPNYYDTPDAQGFVFFDEVLNGDHQTVKVFQKYANDEDISGKLRKPPGVVVIAASNRMSDKAGVIQQSRAFLSRFEQLEVFSDPAHNLKFAEAAGWHPVLIKFLEKHPDLIDNYDEVFAPRNKNTGAASRDDVEEEAKRGVWANMRSWERISKLDYAASDLKIDLLPCRVTGNVGNAVGVQYHTYRVMFDKIASVEDILANPKKIVIPTKMDELFVTVGMLANMVPQDKMKQAGIYIDRLPGDIRALAIRRLVRRSQKDITSFNIGAAPEYQKWMEDPEISAMFEGAR